MRERNEDRSPPPPGLALSLVPVATLIVALFLSIRLFDLSPHIPLILAAAVVVAIGCFRGYAWKIMERGLVNGIGIAMPSILILIAIGMLIGVWIASGIVPLLIYYGLLLLSPAVFLPAACLISAIVSLAVGSSWSTAGTVGVALVGVGQGLGFPLPLVAGAVVSGAYFGDKMSPLSETTNLAPAVAGSELFEHIRHMTWTSGPSIAIALALYAVVGMGAQPERDGALGVENLLETLDATFNLSPWLLLAPLCVLGLIAARVPALPAVFGGALVGGLCGVWVQGAELGQMLHAAQSGYQSTSGVEQVDELLSRGGLESMFWTISLILCSMGFGGVMESTGMLRAIAGSVLRFATSAGRLTAAVVGTCIGMNVIAPDQYLSLIVPGRMYREAYEKAGLHAKNLSRTLEDAGTLTSPLVPWNTCGVFMFAALTVSPFAYLPYAFFNLLSPIVSLVLGFTGWTMARRGGAAKSDPPDEP